MSVSGPGGTTAPSLPKSITDTSTVGKTGPNTGPKYTEVAPPDPFGYSVEEQSVFDELSSGMPPPSWPPPHSSPDAQTMMDELGALVDAAAPLTAEGEVSLQSAMRMLKELMLKNRERELSLQDQQTLQIYELKLQAIEKDKKAAQAEFVAALIKGGTDFASGGLNMAGGIRGLSALKGAEGMTDAGKSLMGGKSQAISGRWQGAGAGVSGAGTIGAAFFEKEAKNLRAEAETLRAKADKLSNMLSQTRERFALAREVFLDTQQTERAVSDAMNAAINKRLSV